jgi:signal peptidase II
MTAPAPARPGVVALAYAVAAVAFVADLITKMLAVRHLPGHGPVHLVGDLLELELARNPGAAFSTGTSHTAIISVIAIVAAAVVVWFLAKVRSIGWAIALGLLLAGILGNLSDRIFRAPGPFRGHVVDFIALPHWPVFNVADMCINVAAVLILILAVRGIRLDGTREQRSG